MWCNLLPHKHGVEHGPGVVGDATEAFAGVGDASEVDPGGVAWRRDASHGPWCRTWTCVP